MPLNVFKGNLQVLPNSINQLPPKTKLEKLSPKDINLFIRQLMFFIPYFCRHPRRIIEKVTILGEDGLLEVVKDLHRLTGGNVQVWHGTIGEVIATVSVLSRTDFLVPAFKLRLATNQRVAMHGDDVLAFRFNIKGEPEALLIVEAKNYLTGAHKALNLAHETLVKVSTSEPVLFDFIINYLDMEGRTLEAQLVERFLDEYNYKYNKNYMAFIVTDPKSWKDDYVASVPHKGTFPLSVISFLIPDWEKVQEKVLHSTKEEKLGFSKLPEVVINDLKEMQKLLDNKNFKLDQERLASAALAQDLRIEHRQRIQYKFDPLKIEKAAKFILRSAFRIEKDNQEQAQQFLKEAANIYERLSIWHLENNNKTSFIHSAIYSAFLYTLAGYSANSRVLIERIIPEDLAGLPHKFYVFFILLISGRIAQLQDKLAEFFFTFEPTTVSDDNWEKGVSSRIQEINDYTMALAFVALIKYIKQGGALDVEKIGLCFEIAINEYATIGDYYSHGLVSILDKYFNSLISNSTRQLLSNILGEALDEKWAKYLQCISSFGRFPMIILWKSQQKILIGGLLGNQSLVVSMPTSAGKTKVMELAIFQALKDSSSSICIYVVPTRALASEVEESLSASLGRMGIGVSILYGGYEFNSYEQELIETNQIIVLTPEKLDLLLRNSDDFKNRISLIIIDEFHESASASDRSLRTELTFSRLFYIAERNGARIICLSAVIKNPDDFAKWISGQEENKIEIDWTPTRQRYALFEWYNDTIARVRYLPQEGDYPKEDFYVPLLFKKSDLQTEDGQKIEVSSRLGIYYSKTGPTLIFTTTKSLVEQVVTRLLTLLQAIEFTPTETLSKLIYNCQSILGPEHLLVSALKVGFAYHHADLPKSVKRMVENAIRNDIIQLLVSTTTLSQGVNLPIKNVVVHSLWFGRKVSMPQFWNAVGRAGRAGYETEGHIVFCSYQDLRRVVSETDSETSESFLASGLVKLSESRLPSINNIQDFCEKLATVSTRQFREHGDSYDTWGTRRRNNADIHKESILSILDSQLLAWLLETMIDEVSDEYVEMIFGKLLCTIQAFDLAELKELKISIKNRFNFLNSALPNASEKALFNRTGLAKRSNQLIQDYANVVLGTLHEYMDIDSFSEQFWQSSLEVFAKITEFEIVSKIDSALLVGWVNGSSYRELSTAYFDNDIETTVKTIEAIVYNLPWGLNALVQHLKFLLGEEAENLPTIFKNLPALVSYGVPNFYCVYAISNGIPDRGIAIIIGNSYRNNILMPGFSQFKRWLSNLSKEEFRQILVEASIDDEGMIEDCFNSVQRKLAGSSYMETILTFKLEGDNELEGISISDLILVRQGDDFWITGYDYKHKWKLLGEMTLLLSLDRQVDDFEITDLNAWDMEVTFKLRR